MAAIQSINGFLERHLAQKTPYSSDVNKDWTCKDKDKDKDQAYKDQDKDKD